ncbi:hypothetical protein O1O06_18065 [Grimontia hollisae]|nr:hypothetical protein [Grimontia hollisae]MDF2186644.1 hypothetical protein [Grimontia hollisae]
MIKYQQVALLEKQRKAMKRQELPEAFFSIMKRFRVGCAVLLAW